MGNDHREESAEGQPQGHIANALAGVEVGGSHAGVEWVSEQAQKFEPAGILDDRDAEAGGGRYEPQA
jgi:hypothetical protein